MRNWVDQAQNRDYWGTYMNVALNFQVPLFQFLQSAGPSIVPEKCCERLGLNSIGSREDVQVAVCIRNGTFGLETGTTKLKTIKNRLIVSVLGYYG